MTMAGEFAHPSWGEGSAKKCSKVTICRQASIIIALHSKKKEKRNVKHVLQAWIATLAKILLNFGFGLKWDRNQRLEAVA